jgi:hypothetical protein
LASNSQLTGTVGFASMGCSNANMNLTHYQVSFLSLS